MGIIHIHELKQALFRSQSEEHVSVSINIPFTRERGTRRLSISTARASQPNTPTSQESQSPTYRHVLQMIVKVAELLLPLLLPYELDGAQRDVRGG